MIASPNWRLDSTLPVRTGSAQNQNAIASSNREGLSTFAERALEWAAQKRYDAGERDEKTEIRRIDMHGLVPASALTFKTYVSRGH